MFYLSTLPKATGSPIDRDHVTNKMESRYVAAVESAD